MRSKAMLLVGGSALVRGLRDAVARQAKSVEPLLLTGPPGSGKEAVARAVHDASGRTGAFIFVSCAEINTQFGHAGETAAPRTVEESLIGSRLELASGGTVFLDAVHELPSDLQHALHSMLDGGRSRPPRRA